MDSKIVGKKIAALRRAANVTQADLASKLNVSDKTVSKWERGLGYPEITQLPLLGKILGVTLDQLLSENGTGIAVAGNLMVDNVKSIDVFPKMGQLANMQAFDRAVGGCVSNVSIDLAVIDPLLPVYAIGKVGNDENGKFLTEKLRSYGVNVANVKTANKTMTSFCDVMSVPNGERTFFSFGGANAEFAPDDVPVSDLTCKIFHIGYILLLDQFDAADEEYGTVMARFLHGLQQRGIKTSIDVVSSSNLEEYERKIKPALAYCDYAIINELECCQIWGLSSRTADGALNVDAIYTAMQKSMALGVKEKIIVHAKEGAFCLNKDGAFTKMGSLILPEEWIKGSVGAGDAFCAGCLYGVYNDFSDEEMLGFASAAAACSLFASNSVDGMKNKQEIEKIAAQYKKRAI